MLFSAENLKMKKYSDLDMRNGLKKIKLQEKYWANLLLFWFEQN